MRRSWKGVGGRTGAIASFFMGFAMACSAPSGPLEPIPPSGPPPATSPFLMSNPVRISTDAEIRDGTPLVSGSAYLSLPPGTLPQGSSALVVNRRTTRVAVVALLDGGFDPVPLPAQAGDTIVVTVQSPAILPPYIIVVPEKARPIIVRVVPPKSKRDVPLNARIMVTFSEPMDPVSLVGAFRVTQNGVPVAGELLVPPNGEALLATFIPAADLLPGRTYDVTVGTSARDRDGESLETALQFEFSTALAAPGPVTGAIEITSPTSGAEAPRDYVRLDFQLRNVTMPAQIGYRMVSAPAGSIIQSWWQSVGQQIARATLSAFHIPVRLLAGSHTFVLWARGADGEYVESAPVAVMVVEPDPAPRLVIQEFRVAETSAGNFFWYAPRLVVADAPGMDGIVVVGFEMLSIPGLGSPFPRVAARIAVAPGRAEQLFWGDGYGDWQLSFLGREGQASTGGMASARVTYRDQRNHHYVVDISGPIVPDELPTTYTVGCALQWATAIGVRDTC